MLAYRMRTDAILIKISRVEFLKIADAESEKEREREKQKFIRDALPGSPYV